MLKSPWWPGSLEVGRKILAVLVLVSFTLASACALFGWAFLQVVTNPASYEKAIHQPQVFAWSRTLIDRQLVTFIREKNQSIPILNQISESYWQSMTAAMVPDSWIEDIDRKAVGLIMIWLQDDSQALPPILADLKIIKDNLRSQKGSDGILQLTKSLPACPEESQAADLPWLTTLQCIPKNVNLLSIAPLLASSIADQLPDQVSVSDVLQNLAFTGTTGLFMENARAAYQALTTGLELLTRLSFLFLSLYGLLHSASLFRLIGAARYPFYAAGILSFLLIAGLHFFLQPALSWLLQFALPQESAGLSTIILELADQAKSAVESIWLWWAGGLVAAGIVFHLVHSVITIRALRQLEDAEKAKKLNRVAHKQFR